MSDHTIERRLAILRTNCTHVPAGLLQMAVMETTSASSMTEP